MSAVAVLAGAAAAGAVLLGGWPPGRARVLRAVPQRAAAAGADRGRGDAPLRPPRPGSGAGPGTRARRVAALAAASMGVLLLPGAAGLLAGLVLGVLVEVGVARLEPASARRARAELTAALPLGCDLLAACLAAGAEPEEALAVVAEAVPDPLGESFAQVAARLRLGSAPAGAWALVTGSPALAGLHPVARLAVRAAETGAALSPALAAFAEQQRQRQAAQAQARLGRAGVHALLPLGLCFLPAFLLVGVLPVVAGGALVVLGSL